MALRELRINDLAVIDEVRMEFADGVTAVTGETGAGKSVCLLGLRLALGQRADGMPVRDGSPRARVAAVFDDIPQTVRRRLEESGVEADDELITLSREIPREGRGTCRINGALVAASLLREIGEMLAEVTRQGASARLLRASWQRDLLDEFGGTDCRGRRRAVAVAVSALREAEIAFAEAVRLERSGAAEIEGARDLIDDLGGLDLRDGEDSELAQERLVLRNAVQIVTAARALYTAASGAEEGSAADMLGAAAAAMDPLRGTTPEIDDLLAATADGIERLREIGGAARHVAETVGADPGRLQAVEERLDLIATVKRRHGSVAGALDALAAARSLVAAVDDGDDRGARLAAEVATARTAAAAAALDLSGARSRAARALEVAVERHLADLEMPAARFRVVLSRSADPDGVPTPEGTVRCGITGIDDVEFRLSSNAGGVPIPLAEGISGGELSRLALALRAVAADDCPTLVLDEVDTGIGGETAARLGDVLVGIGDGRQVVVVTHRPEIAARAHSHHLVAKSTATGTARTTVTEVDGPARIDEIARLMSGRATAAARSRAGELLREGAGARERRRRHA